jgi:molybdopterin converting factor small subunit
VSVKLRLITSHPTLAALTGGQRTVEVEGKSVYECLDYLRRNFPATKEYLFDNEGKLWGNIGVFLNRSSIYSDQPVKDGDEIALEMGVAGG